MKRLFNVMAVAITLGGVGQVVAASNVDLSVKGSITPAACTPTLSKGGVVDHGKISVSDLNPKPHLGTILPVATLELMLGCAAPTLVAIKSRDNRAGSSPESQHPSMNSNFGLGFVNGDKKVGWYLLKMSHAQSDGVVHSLIESPDGITWFNADPADQVWQPGWLRTVASASGGVALPVSIQNMTANIHIETSILSRVQLPQDQEIPIDGSATLDIVYL